MLQQENITNKKRLSWAFPRWDYYCPSLFKHSCSRWYYTLYFEYYPFGEGNYTLYSNTLLSIYFDIMLFLFILHYFFWYYTISFDHLLKRLLGKSWNLCRRSCELRISLTVWYHVIQHGTMPFYHGPIRAFIFHSIVPIKAAQVVGWKLSYLEGAHTT